jgi:hypothetical protein
VIRSIATDCLRYFFLVWGAAARGAAESLVLPACCKMADQERDSSMSSKVFKPTDLPESNSIRISGAIS